MKRGYDKLSGGGDSYHRGGRERYGDYGRGGRGNHYRGFGGGGIGRDYQGPRGRGGGGRGGGPGRVPGPGPGPDLSGLQSVLSNIILAEVSQGFQFYL